jgi:hypothetical protein
MATRVSVILSNARISVEILHCAKAVRFQLTSRPEVLYPAAILGGEYLKVKLEI